MVAYRRRVLNNISLTGPNKFYVKEMYLEEDNRSIFY